MAKKRRTLRGTGLNGKGQGADALLGNLRSHTQAEKKEHASPPEPQEPPAAVSAEPEETKKPAAAKAPKAPDAQPETERPAASNPKKSKASDKSATVAVAASPKKRPATRRAAPPESATATAHDAEVKETAPKTADVAIKTAQAEAPAKVEKENAPAASPKTASKAETRREAPTPAPAEPEKPAAHSSTTRVQCTCYLEPDVEIALDQVQALYELADRDVEKSEIVNEALRRYLPLVSPKAGLEFTTPSGKSSAMVKRTYNLDPALKDRLNRIQLQYRLKGRKIKKFVLVNEALHRYLPQIKEEFRYLLEE